VFARSLGVRRRIIYPARAWIRGLRTRPDAPQVICPGALAITAYQERRDLIVAIPANPVSTSNRTTRRAAAERSRWNWIRIKFNDVSLRQCEACDPVLRGIAPSRTDTRKIVIIHRLLRKITRIAVRLIGAPGRIRKSSAIGPGPGCV